MINPWKIVLFGILGTMFAVSRTCHAHDLSYMECYAVAHSAMAVTEMRDNAVTQQQAMQHVMMMAHQAYGEPDSIVQDEEDVKGLINLVNDVYGGKNLFKADTPVKPGQAYDLVFDACTKGKHKPQEL